MENIVVTVARQYGSGGKTIGGNVRKADGNSMLRKQSYGDGI